MGRMISRAAAAAILGCSQQTVSNYAGKGLLDVSLRRQKGRQGYFFDEDQVRSLAPRLRDLAGLQEEIDREERALRDELSSLRDEREAAREEILRLSGGKKTWAHFCGLVAGAYAFVQKLSPVTKSAFEADVLSRVLALQDYEDIIRETKSSPYRVKAAVTAVAKRMLKIPTLTERYEEISLELARTRAENARLKEALAFKARAERMHELKVHEGVYETAEDALLSTPVTAIGFTKPTLRALQKNGLSTVRDIVAYREIEFWDLRGVGMQTAAEVTKALRGVGLDFRKATG